MLVGVGVGRRRSISSTSCMPRSDGNDAPKPEPLGGDETHPERPPPGARLAVDPDLPAYLSTARGLGQTDLLGIGTLRYRLDEIRDD